MALTAPAIDFMVVRRRSRNRPQAFRRSGGCRGSSLYWVNSGWIIGRPTRLDRPPSAGIGSERRTAHTPILPPALRAAGQFAVRNFEDQGIPRYAPRTDFLRARGPSHSDRRPFRPEGRDRPHAARPGSIRTDLPPFPPRCEARPGQRPSPRFFLSAAARPARADPSLAPHRSDKASFAAFHPRRARRI